MKPLGNKNTDKMVGRSLFGTTHTLQTILFGEVNLTQASLP